MAACAAASIADLPVQASSSTRRPMAAVLGVMLGCSFRPNLFSQLAEWWLPLAMLPLFLLSAAALCVTYFRRVAKFDPATAYFAGMPGGIAEMVLLGAERGADERAIGLIHGARIFLVVFILPFIIRYVHAPAPAPAPESRIAEAITTSGAGSPTLLAWGLGCVVVGLMIGRALKLPAWHLLGPLAASATLHMTGVTDFEIPLWAVGVAQVGLGATIGCRFVGLTLRQLGLTLLLSAGSTAILLTLTFAWAFALGAVTRLDPALITLAYSPGGLAEMSMVALSLGLEASVVVIHHLARVVLVLIGASTGFRLMGEKT
jgi:membrane AbrB-like protein